MNSMLLVSLFFLSFFVTSGNAFAPRTSNNVNVGVALRRTEELKMAKIPLLGRFRKKKEIPIVKPIQVGDVLPDVDIEVTSNGVSEPAAISQVLDGEGTKLLIGMPGAYTPTCSSAHLPGYRKYADKLAALGVNKIAIVTTNDRFVLDAWAKEMGIIDATTDSADKKGGSMITMLSDGDSDLVKKLGLVDDMGFGVGIRSKRFVLIIQEGVVTHIEIDEGLDTCENTSAESIVNILAPPSSEVSESEIDTSLVIGGGAVLLAVALFFLLPQGGGGDASAPAAATVKSAPEAIRAMKATGGVDNFLLLKQYIK